MPHSALTALSPLDGRYAPKLAALRPLLSEYGLMHRRVQVEVEWFIALSDAGFDEFPALPESVKGLLRSLVVRFSEADAQAIKDIEKETNHDVKAVEYWLRQRIGHVPELKDKLEFIHFACTSEDINNTSHALMLKSAREQVILPAIDGILTRMQTMAHRFAAVPMLSRTHGQTASPTTVGKEVANVLARLTHARARIADVVLLAKMNGAVGNYNAHVSAYPHADWEEFSRKVVEERLGPEAQPLHDPDRAARLHGRAVRRHRAPEHDPDRLVARRLGLREPGLLQAEDAAGRSGLVDDAAQGQPDRLRERRRQSGHGQRDADAHVAEAAGQPLAA